MSHWNSNEKLKEKFGSGSRKTLDRFTTKDSYTWNSHIIRKVLQCEAWILSGGDHCWFERVTRKKRPVTRDIIIVTVIIIVRHQSSLDRPVSTSSNSLFKGLPSRLRPFGLQFSIICVTLLLFILVRCRSKFHLLSSYFPVSWFCFQLFAISSSILWSKTVYRLFFWKILSRLMSVVL